MRVVVTGADGFIGKNLCVHLSRNESIEVVPLTRGDSPEAFSSKLERADFVFHLAGVNRPQDPADFHAINAGLTQNLLEGLRSHSRTVPIVFTSSSQAEHDNPYGASKRAAETLLQQAASEGHSVKCYRLPGVFGKWCKPHYNSVVATFCHQVARSQPYRVEDAAHEIRLVYIDDVVEEFAKDLAGLQNGFTRGSVEPVHVVSLGRLASLLEGFKEQRTSLRLPNFADPFVKRLYTTYLSYLPEDDFAYDLLQREDARGTLFELLKSESGGQIFCSSTKPGATRGNHYHHSKVEKFCVVTGTGCIRFRHVLDGPAFEYSVSGAHVQVVDIPPGYTHSIENTGTEDMVTLFWANEPFDQERPDTVFLDVL